jgi:hypothetical protein
MPLVISNNHRFVYHNSRIVQDRDKKYMEKKWEKQYKDIILMIRRRIPLLQEITQLGGIWSFPIKRAALK